MPTSSNNSSSSNPDASDLYNLYMSFLLNLGAHLKSFVSYFFTLYSLSMRASRCASANHGTGAERGLCLGAEKTRSYALRNACCRCRTPSLRAAVPSVQCTIGERERSLSGKKLGRNRSILRSGRHISRTKQWRRASVAVPQCTLVSGPDDPSIGGRRLGVMTPFRKL